MNQKPDTVHSIPLASALATSREFRYPSDHNPLMDQEDDDHQTRTWRDGVNMNDVQMTRDGNMGIFDAKQRRLYIKHNVNSPVGLCHGRIKWYYWLVLQNCRILLDITNYILLYHGLGVRLFLFMYATVGKVRFMVSTHLQTLNYLTDTNKEVILHSISCADPESFCRGGVKLFFSN